MALSPDNVDCIVFWTKNPAPMLDKLERIDALGFAYYFQFTLTPYDQTIEHKLPPKTELMRTFTELAKRTSVERVVWRYDPILIDAVRTLDWHIERFSEMCGRLHTFTRRCILSFIDPYKSIGNDRHKSGIVLS